MADENKIGAHWQDDELDAIVADYFDMLAADIAGRPYVKAKHSAALMAQIGRTHRSVEFKHQNIDAIDRYLTAHPAVLEPVPPPPPKEEIPPEIFVLPPVLGPDKAAVPERLRRLVRKFDPVKRDYLNRLLGKGGKSFVIDLERRQLAQADRPDLARKVRWIAAEDGDGAGYDVLSFYRSGKERLIEVKTTNGSARTPFFISRNECALAQERPSDWCIYRVHLFATEPHIFTITPPLESSVHLSTETWRASF